MVPQRLKSVASVKSRLNVLRDHLGTLPVSTLEGADEINRFKTVVGVRRGQRDRDGPSSARNAAGGDELGHGADTAAVQPVAVPPVRRTMNKKAETSEIAGSTRDEEKRLLDTALPKMNTAEHQYVGPLLHDRIIGALELCCRRGEMLMIQNERVNWDTCQIGIPGATAKDKENRRIPFDPKGRLAAILEAASRHSGPTPSCSGRRPGVPAEHPDGLGNPEATRERVSNRSRGRRERNGTENSWSEIDLRWHDLRHEGACRLLADGVDVRIIQLMLGHASMQQTQRYLNVTDEELQERTGGELENERATAFAWRQRRPR